MGVRDRSIALLIGASALGVAALTGLAALATTHQWALAVFNALIPLSLLGLLALTIYKELGVWLRNRRDRAEARGRWSECLIRWTAAPGVVREYEERKILRDWYARRRSA